MTVPTVDLRVQVGKFGTVHRVPGDSIVRSAAPASALGTSLPTMRDGDVRSGLTAALQTRLDGVRHICVPEVDIRWHIPARMDLLVVSDRINGFEIKSDADSLTRLPRQVEAYGDVVEYAHLVVGPRLREAATALVPDWWGIWAATWQDVSTAGARCSGDAGSPQVVVRQVRRGTLNPQISPLAVTSFLTRADLTAALRGVGERQLSNKSVDELRTLLVTRAGARGAVRLAREALVDRQLFRERSLTGVR